MARIGLTLDRKFKRLARALDDVQVGFGEILARGALELLWDAAYEAADDYIGDVVDVEAGAHWRGRDGVLCAALLGAGGEGRAGFVDEGGSPFWPEGKPGTYRVHDLWDHAPDFVARRATRETEREAKGETLSELRSKAGKKGRAKQLAGTCPASGGQMDNGSPSLADPNTEKGGQKSSLSLPAPGRPVPGSSNEAPPPRGGLPTRDELAGAQHPGVSALRLALGQQGLDLAWPAHDKRQAIEDAVARVGLDRCVRACIDDTRGMRQPPKSLGIFAAMLESLRPLPPVEDYLAPWWARLAPDDLARYEREREAIDAELRGAPPGCVGARRPDDIRALIARYQTEARQ